MIVSVYILDEDNETTRLRGQGLSRNKTMRRVDSMHPDHGVADGHLGVERATGRVSSECASLESEDFHEETLGGLQVGVDTQRNDLLGSRNRISSLVV
jgi:hypothetical protein